MEEQFVKRIKLGAFVLIATACLILGLYFIGSKRNIFHSKINVSAVFNNISGLIPGNNVQFNGINIGTVSKVYVIADTAIKVEFTIDENVLEFITLNAIASIGTDGLLGNKLVNIAPFKKGGMPLQEGSIMNTVNSIQIDKAIRKLLVTNNNLNVISENLKTFSNSFNSSNSIWHLLSDTIVAENVRKALVHIKVTSDRTAIITGDLSKIIKDVQSGKGTIGALLTDTSFSHKLKQTIIHIEAVTDSFAIISGNFKSVSEKIKNGNGAIGTLISDTTFAHNLNTSMDNIKKGSDSFNENMEALKHSWPFRKYFRKKHLTTK
jgi:phospholipid/cholesterol/gamma-HCH transport system substrate-binding protein